MVSQLNHWKLLILLTALFGVYVLFPNNNSSLDAFAYAADLKYNFPSLFRSHHLLYGPFYALFLVPARSLFPGLDVLYAAQILNALCAIAGLYLLFLILKQLQIKENTALIYLLLVGTSFGVWRFSTENEVYLVPVFFSLWASLFFLKALVRSKERSLFCAGLLAALACLFHQIHFFWWLGLLITAIFYFKNGKAVLLFSIPALIVPAVYITVIVCQQGFPLTSDHLLHYVFRDYYSGIAKTETSLSNIFFTLVGLWRSFLQLFPSILLLLQKSVLFYLPLLFLAASIFLLFQKATWIGWSRRLKEPAHSAFVKGHLLILGLQFAFATWSAGNSEFMVMIPYLAAILLASHHLAGKLFLRTLAATFIIWNFLYGIFPNYYYKFTDSKEMVGYIRQHPDAVFIIKNNEIPNRYAYETGIDNYSRIYTVDQITRPILDSLLHKGIPVYTDLIDPPKMINRETFSGNSLDPDFWNDYRRQKVDSFPTFYGPASLFRIK